MVKLKAIDLKPGNYVLYCNLVIRATLVCEDEKEDWLYYYRNNHGRTVPIKHCEPIEITTDLLLKLGFEDRGKGYYHIGPMYVCAVENKFCYRNIWISYLHELQNFYYLFTKEELIINL